MSSSERPPPFKCFHLFFQLSSLSNDGCLTLPWESRLSSCGGGIGGGKRGVPAFGSLHQRLRPRDLTLAPAGNRPSCAMSLSLQQLGDSTSGSENLLDFAACDDNTALSSSSPSSSALLESSIDCFPSFLTPSPTAGAGVERMAAETGDGVFASSGRAFEAVFAGFDNFDDVEINNSNSKIDCFNSGNDSIATSASTSSSFSKFGVNVCSNMVFSEKLSDG